MKLSSRIIAKILTLCGISLTCAACYGPPKPLPESPPYCDEETRTFEAEQTDTPMLMEIIEDNEGE